MALQVEVEVPIPLPAISPNQNVLPVRPSTQKPRKSWCWAACLEMILDYYGIEDGSQCEMAHRLFQREDCCGDRPGRGCDYTCSDTDIPLLLEQMGFGCVLRTRPIMFDTLKAEINANRPMIAAHVHFTDKGTRVIGHMVVISGWEERGEKLLIHAIDPIHDVGRHSFFSFLAPNGKGTWVRTYMDIKPLERDRLGNIIRPLR